MQFFYNCYNFIFAVSPDGSNSNLKQFFGATHSHVVQEHPDTNEFCSNARFPFWINVAFRWEKWVINLSTSSAFKELSPYKQKRSPHSAAPHEFTKVKIITLYNENMLSSNLLETSCYQDTLAINLKVFWTFVAMGVLPPKCVLTILTAKIWNPHILLQNPLFSSSEMFFKYANCV